MEEKMQFKEVIKETKTEKKFTQYSLKKVSSQGQRNPQKMKTQTKLFHWRHEIFGKLYTLS